MSLPYLAGISKSTSETAIYRFCSKLDTEKNTCDFGSKDICTVDDLLMKICACFNQAFWTLLYLRMKTLTLFEVRSGITLWSEGGQFDHSIFEVEWMPRIKC